MSALFALHCGLTKIARESCATNHPSPSAPPVMHRPCHAAQASPGAAVSVVGHLQRYQRRQCASDSSARRSAVTFCSSEQEAYCSIAK